MVDSYKVVAEVEKYRAFWKPEKVRVVLLAESHVHTEDADFDNRWVYTPAPVHQGNFVRFVYCLANGERDLVEIPSNKGTWQFWKLLSSCLNNPSSESAFAPLLRQATPDFRERMTNKIQLLERLRRAGVWLLDASIVGVNQYHSPVREQILMHCWENYTGPLLSGLSPRPRHAIVIGKGVEATLGSEIRRLGIEYTLIPQPQARIRGGYASYYNTCFETCSRFCD